MNPTQLLNPLSHSSRRRGRERERRGCWFSPFVVTQREREWSMPWRMEKERGVVEWWLETEVDCSEVEDDSNDRRSIARKWKTIVTTGGHDDLNATRQGDVDPAVGDYEQWRRHGWWPMVMVELASARYASSHCWSSFFFFPFVWARTKWKGKRWGFRMAYGFNKLVFFFFYSSLSLSLMAGWDFNWVWVRAQVVGFWMGSIWGFEGWDAVTEKGLGLLGLELKVGVCSCGFNGYGLGLRLVEHGRFGFWRHG